MIFRIGPFAAPWQSADMPGAPASKTSLEPAPRSRMLLRAAYLLFYGLFAALGAALLARPAWLYFRGRLGRAVLPWEVPAGETALLLFTVLAVFTVVLAVSSAWGRKPRLSEHAVFLGLVGAAVVVRLTAAEPSPAADPGPALIAGLRAAAAEVDQQFAQRQQYALDEAGLASALSRLPRPGFRSWGRSLPLTVRLVEQANGPQLAADAEDKPGTILIAVSPDRSRCWLTAVTLKASRPAVLTSEGRPVLLHARGGTHGAPGRDPMVPAYPSMRAVGRDGRPR